jgi:hypothetical protein
LHLIVACQSTGLDYSSNQPETPRPSKIDARAVEALDLTTRWDVWLDEDGWTTGQPVNFFATFLANQYGTGASAYYLTCWWGLGTVGF